MTAAAADNIMPHGGVKICGIREPRHAVAAVEAGADMLGFVFAPSRRRVSAAAAAACAEAVRGSRAAMVGLFVDATADEINRLAEIMRLDAVQLHGDVAPDLIGAIGIPVIQVLRIDPADSRWRPNSSEPAHRLPIGFGAGSSIPSDDAARAVRSPIAYMIDAFVPGSHGGTGALGDWRLASSIAAEAPVMLAGGLTPNNVAAAISTVSPRAVDVSSGVETAGAKDLVKIRAFITAAKAAFAGG